MEQQKTVVFKGLTTHNRYKIVNELGIGGQGRVLKVKEENSGKSFAIKWYHPSSATEEQRNRISQLVQKGPPLTDVDGITFIWPKELVTLEGKGKRFGYVMPLYDNKRFVRLTEVMNGYKKQPNLKILSYLSYLVCEALESIHRRGYAYCDINVGNIQFDFEKGELVVCDNDNVVLNNSDVGVLGVFEFMAPEVMLRKKKPNAQSDHYSAAVFLYHLWMWEHPMEGAETEKVRCWDIPAKYKYYGEQPVFHHDPKNRINRIDNIPGFEVCMMRWKVMCPTKLKKLFIQVFTEGVHNPEKRPRLSEWKRTFLELEANALKCECGAVNLVDTEQSSRVTCFYCGKKLPVELVLTCSPTPAYTVRLAVRDGAELRGHHLGSTKPEDVHTVVGRVEPHPKQSGAFILRNQTKFVWKYMVGNNVYDIGPGQARAVIRGGKLDIGNVTVKVEKL